MRGLLLLLAAAFVILLGHPCAVLALDQFKLLDLQVGGERLTGRVLTHNDQLCWFLRRDGRLEKFAMAKVTDFKEVGQRFQAHSAKEIKAQLQVEFGKAYEVRTSSHYVVVARPGAAEDYAVMFERIYREFVRLFRARGLEIVEPEFPLVAIVFPDQRGFVAYCTAQGAHLQPGLVGFYLPSSNRVAMYERPNVAEVDGTVIHEATHQVAFNTGIHCRVADHPRWVVEGLATVLEADGIRTRQGSSLPADRVNRQRYLWFQDYANTRRPARSLAGFVREDRPFQQTPLDAYSEAWALSFFLLETRPLQYSKYLKRLVERDPLSAYEAGSRVNDFSEIFGADLDSLETQYLRFIKRIAE